MTYVVTETCINCKDTACVTECPVNCFYEGANMLVIHPGECIDCGNCLPVCPNEAIYAQADVPSELQEFIELNERLSQSGWPNVSRKKGAMGELSAGLSRRELLDESPFTG